MCKSTPNVIFSISEVKILRVSVFFNNDYSLIYNILEYDAHQVDSCNCRLYIFSNFGSCHPTHTIINFIILFYIFLILNVDSCNCMLLNIFSKKVSPSHFVIIIVLCIIYFDVDSCNITSV